MFKDQIPNLPRDCNEHSPVAKPLLARPTPLSPCPDGQTEGWGFSFSISHFPEDTGRAPGTASWEGIANLFWFADRTNNIGGLIATQILPYGGKSGCLYSLGLIQQLISVWLTLCFQIRKSSNVRPRWRLKYIDVLQNRHY